MTGSAAFEPRSAASHGSCRGRGDGRKAFITSVLTRSSQPGHPAAGLGGSVQKARSLLQAHALCGRPACPRDAGSGRGLSPRCSPLPSGFMRRPCLFRCDSQGRWIGSAIASHVAAVSQAVVGGPLAMQAQPLAFHVHTGDTPAEDPVPRQPEKHQLPII